MVFVNDKLEAAWREKLVAQYEVDLDIFTEK